MHIIYFFTFFLGLRSTRQSLVNSEWQWPAWLH